MNFSNLTDRAFWEAKYSRSRPHYRLFDPYYGEKGLLKRSLIPLIKGVRNVLEIGCGSSRYLMFFKLVAGLETHGLDFSEQGLRNLALMAQDHGTGHHLYAGDMFEQDLGDKKFDLVFHSGLVEHFADLDAVFRRCRFFCRDDRLMIFLMPNMQNMAWKWHRIICPNNYRAHIPYHPHQVMKALQPYFNLIALRSWGYPQLYAGGPPETLPAILLKQVNLGLMLWISCSIIGYKGTVGKSLASTWLFWCRAK